MFKIIAYLLSLLACTNPALTRSFVDLEDHHTQDFVIETKQIQVPGFPGAFNASIIEWNDSILMCFRVRNEKMVSTFQMGCVFLDKDFNVISTPSIIQMQGNNPSTFFQNQDPRLIVLNHKLYIIYSNFISLETVVARRMFIAELYCEDNAFITGDQICIHNPIKLDPRWEKNWVPFIYENELLLAYSILPHHILKPSLQTGECSLISATQSVIDWDWGTLRGGTPAIRDGEQYLGFFHSSKLMKTAHSAGKKIQHYFMGAYTYSAHPPFQITHISPEPIVAKGFYHGQSYNTWKPLHVVFPMGCIINDQHVWVSYGRQDFEIWVAKIDKHKLYKSLIPCPLDPDNIEPKKELPLRSIRA